MNARQTDHCVSQEELKVLRPRLIVLQPEEQTITIAPRLESTTAAVFNQDVGTHRVRGLTELVQATQDLRIVCVRRVARDSRQFDRAANNCNLDGRGTVSVALEVTNLRWALTVMVGKMEKRVRRFAQKLVRLPTVHSRQATLRRVLQGVVSLLVKAVPPAFLLPIQALICQVAQATLNAVFRSPGQLM
jgi:hypothetical protein